MNTVATYLRMCVSLMYVQQTDDRSEALSGEEGIVVNHFYMLNGQLETLEVSNKLYYT